MKQKCNKTLVMLIGIFLLILPAKVKALIWLNGNSASGNIAISAAVLLPLPFINLTIIESEPPTDFFGIAQLAIIGHDDDNKYNTLQIRIGSEDPLELPVSYGSFGLHYLLTPGWPSLGLDQSEIYSYLSVGYGLVDSTISFDIDQSISIDRDQLVELLTIFLPGVNFDDYIVKEEQFDVAVSLIGDLSGKATLADPTIAGDFTFSLTLPDDIFIIEIPIEIPNEFEGSLSTEADFNWVPFSPFTTVNISATLRFNGEETKLDPIQFDFLPSGTFILWLDKEE